MESPEPRFSEWLDQLAGPERSPAGCSAAGVSLSMGLGLFIKALHHPPADLSPGFSQGDIELLQSLFRRVGRQLVSAQRAEAGFAGADAAGKPAARLALYRVARTLVELALQGLGQIKPVLDKGGVDFLPDLELAWRLLATALEGGVAACEAHLRDLPSAWIAGEAETLAQQAAYGRELQARAYSELAWRLRRV